MGALRSQLLLSNINESVTVVAEILLQASGDQRAPMNDQL